MAKGHRGRHLPATRAAQPPSEDRPRLAHRSNQLGDEQEVEAPAPPDPREPNYLVAGTGCLRGHDPGSELVEPRLGRVPGQRITRIGVGVVIWVLLGLLFLSNLLWQSLAIIGSAGWLAASAFVQRRAGHRGHCWRTRSWRYAWGGIVPTPGAK